MHGPELVDSLVDAWSVLQPRHRARPEERSELAQRTRVCLEELTVLRMAGSPAVTDIRVARSIRVCRSLADAIQTGRPLREWTRPLPTRSRHEAPDKAVPDQLTLENVVAVGTVVVMRGQLTARAVEETLQRIDAL